MIVQWWLERKKNLIWSSNGYTSINQSISIFFRWIAIKWIHLWWWWASVSIFFVHNQFLIQNCYGQNFCFHFFRNFAVQNHPFGVITSIEDHQLWISKKKIFFFIFRIWYFVFGLVWLRSHTHTHRQPHRMMMMIKPELIRLFQFFFTRYI